MKRPLTWAALLLALAAVLLASAWAGRDRLLAPHLKSLIREVLREEAGLEVTIDSLSGSYFRGIEIRGLKTVRPTVAGPVSALAVQRIHLRYRLLALLQGVEPFLAAASIEVESPRVELDLDRWEDPAPEAADAGGTAALPAVLPALRVSDGVLVLSSAPFTARFEGLSLTSATAPGPRLTIELAAARLEAGRRPHPGADFEPALAGALRVLAQVPWPPQALDSAVDHLHLDFSGRRSSDDSPVHAQATAALQDGRLRIDRLELAAGRSRVLVTDAGAPWEVVAAGDPWALLEAAAGSLSLTTEEIPRLLAAIGMEAPAGGPPIPDHRLALDGRLQAGTVRISRAELIAGEAAVRVGHLETRLSPDALDSPLEASLTVDVPDLGSIAPLFNGPVLAGRLAADVRLSGTLGNPQGRADASVRELALEGAPLGTLLLRVHAAERQVRIESFELTRGGDRLSATGVLRLPERLLENIRVEVSLGDIGASLKRLPAAWDISGRWPVEGRLRGSAAVAGPWHDPDGELALEVQNLKLRGRPFGSGSLRLRKKGHEVAADPMRLSHGTDRLFLQGRFDLAAQQFGATRLELTAAEIDPYLAAFDLVAPKLTGRLSVTLEGSGPLMEPDFTLDAFLGRLSSGEWAVSDNRVQAAGARGRIRFDRIESLTPIGKVQLSGNVEADYAAGVFTATVDRLDLSGDVALALTRPASLRYASPGVVTLSDFDIAGTQGRLAIQGSLSLHGRSDLQADLSLPGQRALRALAPVWPFVSGSLRGELRVSGSWQDPTATLNLTGRDLMPSDEAALPPGPYLTEAEALLQGRRILLTRLDLKGPSAAFEASGEITEWPSLPDLMTGALERRWGRISARAALRVDELGWAARALDGVRRTAGRIEADAILAGPLADPELRVDLRLIDGEIRPEGDLPPLQHLGLNAGFGEERLEIRSLQGEAGGAPFRITGELGTGAPETGVAALLLEGDNLLLYRSETVTLRADTRLTLSGPLSALTLQGALAITDGRLSTRWRFLDTFLTPGRPASESGLRLFSLQTPPFRNMRFQVRISSKAPFRVRTNVARGEVRPELLLAGTGEFPVLTGVVYVDPGRLSLPSTNLRIESGLIRFLPSDPERPVVNLMGSGRIYGYDISLRVEGPYDAPEIFLSSVPPLAHEELLWMLLTGEPPRQEAALSESQQAGMKVAVFVGRDFITHWLESALPESDEAVLDRLDVEVGRSVSRTGQQTIEAQFRLTEGFIRRGDALYLVGEKDIYDTYNMGVRLVFRFQ